MSSAFCADCKYLDKSRRLDDVCTYRYGCDRQKYIIGYITNDNDLKTMGCSFGEKRKEVEQMKLW